MQWLLTRLSILHFLLKRTEILAILIISVIIGYFGGLLYWYGSVMAEPSVPIWAWPFIPDCPLFAWLGGLGLLMVNAHKNATPASIARTQRILLVAGGIFVLLWLSTYLPSAHPLWAKLGATIGLFSWTLLLFGIVFHRSPRWLLAIAAFGNIKYGVWTVSAWLVYWYNTAALYGAPRFTPDSIFMTLTHLGMIVMGIFLLTYFVPDLPAIFISAAWFALSDFVDYGLGFFPGIPTEIPLPIMQWSTIVMTLLLNNLFWQLNTAHRREILPETEPRTVPPVVQYSS